MKPLLLIGLLTFALAACGGDDTLSADEAADRLAGELPPDAREDLEALRDRLSSQAP